MDLKRIMVALRHCGRIQSIKRGKSLHSHVIKHGFSHNIFIANNLLSMYIDFTLLGDAQKLFDEIPDKNIVTWTTMVYAYATNKRPDKAISLYEYMLESELEAPNGFMYSAVLKACALAGDLELGRLIHKRISRDNLENDTVLMNTLLDMYVKCGRLEDAREVFDKLLNANSTSWNTIISGYCKEGLIEEAIGLFHQMPARNAASWNSIIAGLADSGSLQALEFVCMMHKQGLNLDEFTLPCSLKACSSLGLLNIGKQIHCHVIKSGLERSCFTISALLDMYSNCNALSEAVRLFHQYLSYDALASNNLAPWNSMLSGYVINEQNEAAASLLLQIHSSGLYIDSYTFSSALKVCINFLNLRLGLQVHGLIVTSGYQLDYVVGSILIDLYAKLGNVKNALFLFHRLPKKDIIAWSSLIMGCAKVGLNLLAFSLFRDMVRSDFGVDQFVISSILKVCSSLASVGSGKQVHALCVKSGFNTEEVTLTSLIDMYLKCGQIEDGLVLFSYMPERDIVSWTGIIVGCGQNGRAKEAITFFNQMLQSGLKPNEVTFLGVLSACRHAGLVREAWTIFESMKAEFGVEPHLEHYYCMVDLLGQAGCFQEARKLIADMPFEPDKTIWSSMLKACGTHKNIELVGVVAEQLIAASPEDPFIYVMLSNIYAELEMWDSLSKVRNACKKLGRKEAGMSWIEITS
ncbi:pentatricopeptide repeat-containing protein At4g08210-like [Mangifera indica]|uniref:pentatricopeptide repeat-containing protein At4g08210-like n=1 Tax=Mangifera indica TaxID=29780 RepID=UPI001CFC3428|nr:pentatricopeptide repeat-containing protein At4g08210-like [Mangifera indica]